MTVSEIKSDPHVQALKERHADLSQKIEEAQRSPSVASVYINDLKKQKLRIKEKIFAIMQSRTSVAG